MTRLVRALPLAVVAVTGALALAAGRIAGWPVPTAVLVGASFGALLGILVYLVLQQNRERRLSQYRQADLETSIAKLTQALMVQQRRGSEADSTELDVSPVGPPIPDAPEALIAACSSANCVFFAGAGIAAQAGLPTRKELLARLVKRPPLSELQGETDALTAELEDRSSRVADVVSFRMPRDVLISSILAIYRDNGPEPVRIHRILRDIPFSGIITTNYDTLLERAFVSRKPVVLTPTESESFAALLREQRFVIVKLYGDVNDPESLQLSTDQLSMTLFENPAFARTFTSFYSSNTVIFAGASLDDIEEVIDGLRLRASTSPRTHYALVPYGRGFELESDRFISRYGIQLLPYRPSPGHPEVVTFFERLVEAVVRQRPGPRDELRRAAIEEVRLRNIGPFRELDLPLRSPWTVILGNNGSGKSTLLRAIALALSGDDERSAVAGQRLLRTGESSGSIELLVGKDVYRTDLVRDVGRVTRRSTPWTALQAGTWVVFGFPPLRGITARPGDPTAPATSHPVVDDVLPLVLGVVDARLDKLKDWLIGVGLRAAGGRGISSADASRARRLLRSFFDVVNELTIGLRLEFAGVDRDRWEVLVKTDDGIVPIDLISQGTISVLGWVGTVLQRLYEMYPSSRRPESEPGVVLVDEMDAHMHPEWQQNLVPVLQKRFPNLQVIASTHSPLIVCNMDQREIIRMGRGPDPSSIVVEPIAEAMKGLRADQILTSPAFDLETTRDVETVQLMNRYARLLGISQRSEEEEREFLALSEQLRIRVPSWPETAASRQALELIEQWMLERINNRPDEEKRQILAEAERHMARLASEVEPE